MQAVGAFFGNKNKEKFPMDSEQGSKRHSFTAGT